MDAFEALADPLRRELLRRIATGPARVVDLAAAHEVSRPAVSRHLRLLTEAGLASVEDRGRERHYRLEAAGLGPLSDFLRQLQPPRVAEGVLDALETEVRRTRRERRRTARSHTGAEQVG
jgi:DNA-binding transcriptional ArsR family regulator